MQRMFACARNLPELPTRQGARGAKNEGTGLWILVVFHQVCARMLAWPGQVVYGGLQNSRERLVEMRSTSILAIVFALSGLVYCGCGSGSKPNLTELEGTWVGQEIDGPKGECRMTVLGNHMKFQGARTNEWYSASLTLNQSTSPKQAVIQIEECGFPQYVNKNTRAIYKLEKNTLTIGANEPGVDVTPTEFQRSRTNHTRGFVFTKQWATAHMPKTDSL